GPPGGPIVEASAAGGVVRGRDRFRFRGAPLSEEYREHHDAPDGHELALPVLKRLEPEGGCRHELHGAYRWLPVRHLLSAVLSRTSQGVQHEREHEEERECDPQGILVERELPSSTPHRTGSLLQVGLRSRVGILLGIAAEWLGFRRALLDQPDREQDVGSHLEELALPVLEGGLHEVARGEVGTEAHRWFAMFLLLCVVGAPAGEALAHEKDREEAEQDDRQAVVSKPSGHDSSSVGWRSNFTIRRHGFGVAKPQVSGLCQGSSGVFATVSLMGSDP